MMDAELGRAGRGDFNTETLSHGGGKAVRIRGSSHFPRPFTFLSTDKDSMLVAFLSFFSVPPWLRVKFPSPIPMLVSVSPPVTKRNCRMRAMDLSYPEF